MHKVFAFSVLACSLLASRASLADTFSVGPIDTDRDSLVGIDFAGDVLVRSGYGLYPPGDYVEFTRAGKTIDLGSTYNLFTFAGGSPCTTSLPKDYQPAGRVVCNGGFLVAGIGGHNGQLEKNISVFYPGAPDGIIVAYGSADALVVNSVGDFAFTNGTFDEIELGIDTPVPEPSTLSLLGTGLLGMFAAGRKGLKRHRSQ